MVVGVCMVVCMYGGRGMYGGMYVWWYVCMHDGMYVWWYVCIGVCMVVGV